MKLTTLVKSGRCAGILVTKGKGCWNMWYGMTLEYPEVRCEHLEEVRYILACEITQKLLK